jgi:hypothetical protein
MRRCRLCQEEKTLCDSHIVSEFLHQPLYNEKGHMMGISGRGNKGWKPLQKGLREHLFCTDCEQHFNEHYEKPFRAQWCVTAPLPNPWTEPDVYWVNMDYATFKLFHLTTLFRASVSSLPTYSAVDLGPHEERLRNMLRDQDPGQFWQYPIMGQVVIHHKTGRVIDMITWPEMFKDHDGRRCYRMLYAGVEWSILVTSQRSPEFEKVSLQDDGRMPLCVVPWNEVTAIQDASRALSKRNPQPDE